MPVGAAAFVFDGVAASSAYAGRAFAAQEAVSKGSGDGAGVAIRTYYSCIGVVRGESCV